MLSNLITESQGWVSPYKSKQGNIGLGVAIGYYSVKGFPVSIPLNDTQGYDLIIEELDDESKLKRVQIKTTQRKLPSGHYIVLLKNCGGSSGKSKTRHFDKTKADILFVVTKEGGLYEIPCEKVNKLTALVLNENFEDYKIR